MHEPSSSARSFEVGAGEVETVESSSCPKQGELFGDEAFRPGWNVLILRLPEHGLVYPRLFALLEGTAPAE